MCTLCKFWHIGFDAKAADGKWPLIWHCMILMKTFCGGIFLTHQIVIVFPIKSIVFFFPEPICEFIIWSLATGYLCLSLILITKYKNFFFSDSTDDIWQSVSLCSTDVFLGLNHVEQHSGGFCYADFSTLNRIISLGDHCFSSIQSSSSTVSLF